MAIKIGERNVTRIVDKGREVVRVVRNGVDLWNGEDSCFSAGYWIDNKPWTDAKAWKD